MSEETSSQVEEKKKVEEKKPLSEEQKQTLEKTRKQNYYEVLDLDKYATNQQIHSAYRTKMKLYHPDISKDNSTFAYEMLYTIVEAYTVLSDPRLKKEYDESLNTDSIFDPDGNFSSYYDMASENIIRNNKKFNYDHYFYTYKNKKQQEKEKEEKKGSTFISDKIDSFTDKFSNYFFSASNTNKFLVIALISLLLVIAMIFEANNFWQHYRETRYKNMIRSNQVQEQKEEQKETEIVESQDIVIRDKKFMPEDVKEFLDQVENN
ncbi:MAG: DnaJ domain-containing protein [Clostridia bacterium]|nr:DnaJ domain-containing protein [Clostridia bacterium]